jgi:hypothetical protein
MNLFGLEGIGFIISLAMTLLVSGAIMFYCLRRFKILENSIVEQGKVLQSFIVKYQNSSNNDMASHIALNSAIKQSELSEDVVNQKIEVSDDESEYSNDSSSEDELEIDQDDSDEKDITLTTQDIDITLLANIENVNLSGDDIKTLTITDVTPDLEETTVLDIKETLPELKQEDNLQSDSDSDSDDESVKNDKIIEQITEIKKETVSLDDNDKKKTSNKSLSKMKVDDLRDLAAKESLETTDNLKNMKKDQLLKLFNKN